MTQPLDPAAALFRSAFRRHAAGVAIITASLDSVPFGFTATSIASLSADPPRFTFNMATTSSSWPAIEAATYIGVHMLGHGNRSLADTFARSRERFAGAEWSEGEFGVPVLAGVPGWLVGRIEARLPFDSNAVVVARVVGGGEGVGEALDGGPLLYHGGRYALPTNLEYEI